MLRHVVVLVALSACSSGVSESPDGGRRPPIISPAKDAGREDATPPDVGFCAAPAPGATGASCVVDSDCAVGFCAKELQGFPADGYCTRACGSDSDCAGAVCVETSRPSSDGGVADAGSIPPLCLVPCCGLAGCPPGLLCMSRMHGVLHLDHAACLPGVSTAVDGDPCSSAKDCNQNSACVRGLSTPGGYCSTVGCTVGDDTTCSAGGDALCIQPGDDEPFCLDRCASAADCRESESYRCSPLGNELICAHPAVGAPCNTNSDCGRGPPWVCRSGPDYPGGYCSIENCDQSRCTESSVCVQSGGFFCASRCVESVCRAGYQCRSVAGGSACMP